MADHTHIEWTDATWNIVTGCSIVSAGCTNCYAMRLAGTRLNHHPSRAGLTREVNGNHVWTGETRFNAEWLEQPLHWTKPRRIFVAAHGDLFHEGVTDAQLDQVFAVMALTPQHTYQVLTKRPERMRKYMTDMATPYRVARPGVDMVIAGKVPNARRMIEDGTWPVASEGDIDEPSNIYIGTWPLRNVWLGTSIENQDTADARIPELLATPAAVRWISAEPLLGAVDLTSIDMDGYSTQNALRHYSWREVWESDWSPESTGVDLEEAKEGYIEEGGLWPPTDDRPRAVDWVVVGGESGPGARPMHPDWARSMRDQCKSAGVAFFFKQWGDFLPEAQFDADGFQWAPGNNDPKVHWWLDVPAEGALPADSCSLRIGKKAAGDLLDGVQHHAYPELQP